MKSNETLYIDSINNMGQIKVKKADAEIQRRLKQDGTKWVKDFTPFMYVTDETDEDMQNPCTLREGYCWLISEAFKAPANNTPLPSTDTSTEETRKAFTPGEWIRDPDARPFDIYTSTEKGISIIATTDTKHISHFGTEEAAANASLLVEAKNMYEALKEWLKVINRTDAAKHYYGAVTEKSEAIISRISKQQ